MFTQTEAEVPEWTERSPLFQSTTKGGRDVALIGTFWGKSGVYL
jgi:hypothetical protein